MPRYRLTLEYDGAAFIGWQMQAEGLSVQSVLEKAVAIINGAPAAVHGAGRTDAGVHALGQVAHVDLLREWDPFVLRNALNGNVRPHPVSVLEAKPVADDFHARFAARRRHYLYRILNRRSPPARRRGRCRPATKGSVGRRRHSQGCAQAERSATRFATCSSTSRRKPSTTRRAG